MTSRTTFLIGAGLAALAMNACGQKPAPAELPIEPKADASAQAMRVVRVEKRTVADGMTATGRLVIREEAAVGAEIAGFPVLEVRADVGDWVKKGQPLAVLDGTLLRAQIAQAEANLAQLESSAKFREGQAQRVAGLETTGALSVEAIEQRRAEAVSARAAVAASKAGLEEMRTRERRLVLRAPVSGMVLQRNINPGVISSVGGASPYFRIARDGLVELNAELPTDLLAQLKTKEKAQVVLSNGKTIHGSIRFLSPTVQEATSLGNARIALPFDPDLRAGSFAEARFSEGKREVLTVPSSAVRYEAGGPVLMVVNEANKVQKASVKLGRRYGDLLEVLDGAPAGTRVLETGTAFTLEGDVVRPVESAGAPTLPPPAPAAAAPLRGAK